MILDGWSSARLLQRAYWRQRLDGLDRPTAISGVAATLAMVPEGDPPAEAAVKLPAEETAALRDFARRHRLTPGVLAYAA